MSTSRDARHHDGAAEPDRRLIFSEADWWKNLSRLLKRRGYFFLHDQPAEKQ
jgi:hypothetical protein